MAFKPTPDVKRYRPKVRQLGKDECWPWLGSTMPGGYARFYLRDEATGGLKAYAAHRYGYELAYGVIPAGRHVLHTCSNNACQNPRHMSLSPDRNHIGRDWTRCPHGHAYTPDNTAYHSKTNAKLCKTCNRNRVRDYREMHRTATVVRAPIDRQPVPMA